MSFKSLANKHVISLLALLFVLPYTNANGLDNWHDMSDPQVIFSGVAVSAGNEGVNIAANYGSYLNSQFKQKFTVQAVNDLDYYRFDYSAVNLDKNTGFTVESAWNRDLWGINGFNDSSLGIFTKVPMGDGKFNFHPKLNLGMMWGGDIKSTTYIKFDATTRYSFNHKVWAGISPTYTYSMKGIELHKFQVTLDAGLQISPQFSLAGHINNDDEFWFDVIFTF